MLRDQIIQEWNTLNTKILTLLTSLKAKDRHFFLKAQIQQKHEQIRDKRWELNGLLAEDRWNTAVWGSEKDLPDSPKLIARGKRMDELDAEISEEEKIMRKWQEELANLEITPLTVSLKQEVELLKHQLEAKTKTLAEIRELVEEEKMAKLKELLKTNI